MARVSHADNGIIVGNISDPQGFSTDYEDRRSNPIQDGCPSGDIPTESRLSAVAAVINDEPNVKNAVVSSDAVGDGNVPLPDNGHVQGSPVRPEPDGAELSRPIADASRSLPTTTCAASSAEYDGTASQGSSSAHALRMAAAVEREAQAEAADKAEALEYRMRSLRLEE